MLLINTFFIIPADNNMEQIKGKLTHIDPRLVEKRTITNYCAFSLVNYTYSKLYNSSHDATKDDILQAWSCYGDTILGPNTQKLIV